MTQGFVSNPSINQSVFKLAQGRLTLTSGTPVTSSNVTAATTIYYTPYAGSVIALYSNGAWANYAFSEVSIAVPASTSQMYDVWGYVAAGVLTLELLAWTNDTTRATGLTTQDGVYVKSGDATRRYLGSVRTTTVSGQTEDSLTKRYIWNYYNRVKRQMTAVDSTDSWNYSTAAFRQANNNAANQLDFIVGVSEDTVYAMAQGKALNSTTTARGIAVGVGVDGATTTSTFNISVTEGTRSDDSGYPYCYYDYVLSPGRHTLLWLERGAGADTQTWYGDDGIPTRAQFGIYGYLFG